MRGDEAYSFWSTFCERYDAGEQFERYELEEMAFDCDEVEERRGEVHKRMQMMETIFTVDGRYFSLSWARDLSDYGDHEFYNQPEEVVLHEYEKVIKVREWITKKNIDRVAFKNAHDSGKTS